MPFCSFDLHPAAFRAVVRSDSESNTTLTIVSSLLVMSILLGWQSSNVLEAMYWLGDLLFKNAGHILLSVMSLRSDGNKDPGSVEGRDPLRFKCMLS